MFDRRLHGILPGVRKELGMAWFPLGEVERQLTAHGSGGFFAPHVDTGHPIAANRRISCVYYFYESPSLHRRGTQNVRYLGYAFRQHSCRDVHDAHASRQQYRVLSE